MPIADLVLNTKINIPPQRTGLVARPEVLDKLGEGLNRPLTLVSAPAGFGKTTLLGAWHASKTGEGKPLAWLSLDPEDDDLARFFLYLAAALDTLEQGFRESVLPLLQMNPLPATAIILSSLINELVEKLPDPFVLVLDDYHVIASPEIHEALFFLIEHMPPQMHLAVLTRQDPPLPLARMRARQQLTEIRAADLRFSLQESAQFLNRMMGLDLALDEVESLEKRTEGWIAGLQMAALSLHGRADRAAFIRSFASSHRFIFDYLIEEVMEGQSPEIEEFLLKTAVLERMCAPLCDALTGKSDSQDILLHLEQANLFIIPLDEQRRWYRYHHLFQDLLRQRLEIVQPGSVAGLHQRACRWYQDHGLINDALHHALIGKDLEIVAVLAERLVFESIERHELSALSSWLENLPGELRQEKPWLNVALALIKYRMSDFDQVEKYLRDAEDGLTQWQAPLEQRSYLQSHIAAIQAYLASIRGDIEGVAAWTRRALDLLPDQEKHLRGSMSSLLGTSLQRMGKFEEAIRAYSEGVVASQAAGDLSTTVEIYGDLTGFFVERGQLHEAHATCLDALRLVEGTFKKGGRKPLGAAYIHFRLSTILRHWNELEDSLWHAERAADIVRRWGFRYRLVCLNLGIALSAAGLHAKAMEAITAAEEIARDASKFWLEDARAMRARLWLEQGHPEAAFRWMRASGLSPEDEIHFQEQRLYLILAQVLLARGRAADLDQSLRLLDRLQALFEASRAQAYLLQVMIFKALNFRAKGEGESALSAISHALTIGEPGSYVRVFVCEGYPMKTLLEKALAQGILPVYTRQLLEAFEDDHQAGEPTRARSGPMVEALTRREREVLRLLGEEKPLPEIADQLVVSLETVRTHVKRIYRKLDVHSRFEAVSKARSLELL